MHEKVFDEVVEGVSHVADDIKLAPGMDPSCQMGPLVSDEQYRKVVGYIESGISEGAKVAAGGPVSGVRARLLCAAHRAHQHQPAHEGRAGGDLRARGVRGSLLRPGCRRASSSAPTTPSTAWPPSVWTQNLSLAHKVARGLRAGTVWVNCHNVFDASLPFGGYKQSGWGREMGEEVLNNYTEVKAVTVAL